MWYFKTTPPLNIRTYMAFIEEYVYIFQVIDKDDITLYN
jgi:hypothetical protein